MIYKYSPFIRDTGFIEFHCKEGYKITSLSIERIRDFEKYDEILFNPDEIRIDTDIFYIPLKFPPAEKREHNWVIRIYADGNFIASCQMTQYKWEDELNASENPLSD